MTYGLVHASYSLPSWQVVKLTFFGCDPFNHNSNRSDREKWSTSKGGPIFSKLFRLDRTDPLSFGPRFPEILVEWIVLFATGPEQGCRCCFVDITNTACLSMEKASVTHTLLKIMRLPLSRSI